MTTILHVDSSTLGEGSVTRELTAYAVERFKAHHPNAKVERLDLVADPIPHLMGRPEDQSFANQLKAADTIIIGAPTYNFTIPTQLKAWFDRLAIAGETFRYTENGPEGLLKDKRVIVAIASGGVYEEGHSFEHNQSYVRAFFQFLGLEAEFVVANGVAISADSKLQAISKAKTGIDQLAAADEPVDA
ncbi:FMN-dependent NADH-azoreductase [Sphingomicrobium sediminis]|uniref:FMN dependent NADH:quinone oxidoreductase n=1 Tax=Sphingomicrobium sediminis TaxID=2950949 RepID=A0A9X2EE04_9SPHN|nr:NAD(P)H-dependent oxidoreductase [Sphingomicrobium sediminis]MCM8556230.1 NAD(P)H-dependent oxidoreductase [Sphingomicrobium sediminis]